MYLLARFVIVILSLLGSFLVWQLSSVADEVADSSVLVKNVEINYTHEYGQIMMSEVDSITVDDKITTPNSSSSFVKDAINYTAKHGQIMISGVDSITVDKKITTPNSSSSSSSSSRGVSPARINVNRNSSMASDVKAIWHDSSQRSITVVLKEKARCLNPSLRARLSGPSLAIIDWEEPRSVATEGSGRLSITGRYHVRENGRYFIEIIVLYCRDITEAIDFKNACLEPGEKFRLTSWDASIEVVGATKDRQHMQGYWVNGAKSVVPMYTRWQPKGCQVNRNQPNRPLSQHCLEPVGETRFERYKFQWHLNNDRKIFPDVATLLMQYASNNRRNQTLCFMGASHSRQIVTHLYTQIHLFNETGSIQVKSIDIRFPSNLTKLSVQSVSECTKIVLGIGQWPASFWAKVTNLRPYQDQLRKGLIHLQQIYPNRDNLFFRNLHYTPLGDRKFTCPPIDYRNPRVTDLYNEVHHRLAQSLNITYIDTNFIMSPMWDQAPDWSHFSGSAGLAESLYLAARIMGVLSFNTTVAMPPQSL